MIALRILAASLAIGCATPRAPERPPTIPRPQSFASAPAPEIPGPDPGEHRPVAVADDNACGLPGGLLVSEGFAERAALRASGLRACGEELAACTTYVEDVIGVCGDMERAYQARIDTLVPPPPWWDRFAWGLPAGAALMLGAAWAAGQVAR